MISVYRRHNPKRCKLTLRTQIKCKCPIWASGTDANNVAIRESLKTRDWSKASNIAREWDSVGKTPTQSARTTITELDAAFMQDADARHLASETKRKYRYIFKQLTAFAQTKGIRYVSQIDVPFLSEFRATWKDLPLSATKKLEQLRGICKFALARKWLSDNPALALQMPKPKPTQTEPFTHDEIKRILRAATVPRVRAFILVMRFAGLRISDTAKLERSSLTDNELHLYTHKTGSSVRLPLPKPVADALREISNGNPKYSFWTGASRTTTVTGFWRNRLAGIFKIANIENAHSHRFRDTFATALLSDGVSMESVSTLLGHENIRVTQRHYAKWEKSRQERLNAEVLHANQRYKNGTI